MLTLNNLKRILLWASECYDSGFEFKKVDVDLVKKLEEMIKEDRHQIYLKRKHESNTEI